MDIVPIFGPMNPGDLDPALTILTPPELPPGHVSWTSKDISTADQTFASAALPPVHTFLLASACLVAWKETTFNEKKKRPEDDQDTEPADSKSVDDNHHRRSR